MKQIPLLHRLFAAALLGVAALLTGCNTPGNYTYKEGLDYSQFKTYKIQPMSESLMTIYPVLQFQQAAIYDEINRLLKTKGFTSAEGDAAADFTVKLDYTQTHQPNPDIRLVADVDASGYVPLTIPVGHLYLDIVVKDHVVYRGWSPWGVNIENFNASSARQMVQWCLEKFPPPYTKPAAPEIVQLDDKP